jgi:sec-independent protein translocase protein TatA
MLTGILQPTHLIVILLVALIILGPKRLPDAGRALGEGLREFRHSITAGHDSNPEISASPAVPQQQDPPRPEAPR